MSIELRKEELSVNRSFDLSKASIDEEARTVEIAFSSEEPYERYYDFGRAMEVLDHSPQSMMLDRLENGAAVLVNHDYDDQVGVVVSARVDADRVGRAVIRFSRSARGQEIFNDVVDGIRTLVSVGYKILKYVVEENDDQIPTVRVTGFLPFELSIVAIPADATVGVGRSEQQNEPETLINHEAKRTNTMSEENEQVRSEAEIAADTAKITAGIRTEEMKRINTIRSLSDEHQIVELGARAIEEGTSVADFHQVALGEVGKRNTAAKGKSEHDGDLDLSQKDKSRFSIKRLMAALADPNDRGANSRAQFELEVGIEASKGFGDEFKARGSFIPTSILTMGMEQRALSVGTASAGGNLVGTNLMDGAYIEVLRNTSAVMRAGATVLPGLVGNVAIPRQTGAAASGWLSAEGVNAGEDEATFDQIPLTPKDLAVYTEASRRLLMQSTPAIDGLIMNDLVMAQALALDKAAAYGTGANGQPTGIVNTTGINAVNLTVAGKPTYAELIKLVALCMGDNALMGKLSWLIQAAGWEHFSTTPKQGTGVEGNFILGDNGRLAGYDYIASQQVADTDTIFGNFADVIIGEWGGLEINVDPYTKALSGAIRYITFKTADVAIRHPESFALGRKTS